MKFELCNEYDAITFTKVLILNEIDFTIEVLPLPVRYEDVSDATPLHYFVEIIPKV